MKSISPTTLEVVQTTNNRENSIKGIELHKASRCPRCLPIKSSETSSTLTSGTASRGNEKQDTDSGTGNEALTSAICRAGLWNIGPWNVGDERGKVFLDVISSTWRNNVARALRYYVAWGGWWTGVVLRIWRFCEREFWTGGKICRHGRGNERNLCGFEKWNRNRDVLIRGDGDWKFEIILKFKGFFLFLYIFEFGMILED